MTALVFVDTNVFIYAADSEDKAKQRAAQNWRTVLWQARVGRTSVQVLQEFYAKATYRWPTARDQARQEVNDLLAWRPVVASGDLFASAWKIQDRFRFSFWDSLIVAAAKQASCSYLLTEDLQSEQDLDGLSVVNPFGTTPEAMGIRA